MSRLGLLLILALARPAGAETRPLSELRALLAGAVASHQTRLVIPPGVYRGGPERGHVHLALRGVSDLEIVADGVTLVCTEPTRALDLNGCRRVILRGLTIDYDPLPFTQGDIVAVDPKAGCVDVKIHAGYPVRADTRIDRATRYRKRDKPFMWDTKAEVRPDGIVRVSSKSAAGFAQVGDLASLGGYQPGAVPHTLSMDDCADCTLQNVTVYASNCMGIIASGGDGGHRWLGCRVVPGPPPPGASEARLLSTNADAMLTQAMKVGVRTEGCQIRDAGDDSWSVQSSDYVILKRDGPTVWLASRAFLFLQTGDRLQAALDGPLATVAERRVVSRQSVELAPEIAEKLRRAGPWGYWHLFDSPQGGSLLKLTLSGEVPWQPGDSVYDLDRRGDGFVFRANTVRSSGRILIKAAGLVENNQIDSPFAISVLPEVPYPAAAGIGEIIIRGNAIRDAHAFNPFPSSSQAGAISVTCDGPGNDLRAAGVYGRVVIEDNQIIGGNGAGIVVSSARSVELSRNRLVDLLQIPPNATGQRWRIDNHAAIWLSACDRVTLVGNELINPGPALSTPLGRGPGVGQVIGAADGLARR